MSFFCPYPGVSPQRCFALSTHIRGLGKIISHSDGHSVVIGKTKKPIHRDIKNRRERCSRFKMMFYVTALKFKDGTVCSSDHSLTVPKSIECRRRYFLLAYTQALGGLHRIPNQNILYSVVTSFKGNYIVPKPSLKIKFLVRFCIVFAKAGYTILLL